MRLLSLKFNARGKDGWESPTLQFGLRTTSLFAKNGSGKTPIVQSIAFALGLEVKFRDDIASHCKSVTLTVELSGVPVEIERDIVDGSFVVATPQGVRHFSGEGEFSSALFQQLGVEVPSLVSTGKKPTMPYVSTVLPIFFMKQDGGYLSAYTPTRALFIQDQFVEMLRFVFGYPPKRSYSAKKMELQEKNKLDAVQRKIVFQQQLVARLSEEIDDRPLVEQALRKQSSEIAVQLDEIRSASDKKNSASGALVELLTSKDRQIQRFRRDRSSLQARIDGIDEIRSEIEGEIKTLSLNEESRQIFSLFEDICAKPDCGLFNVSKDSYGKNLLYLKDQIKDLEHNVERAEMQISALDETLSEFELEREDLRGKIRNLSSADDSVAVITAVQDLTRELMKVEQTLLAIERLRAEKRKYIQLDEERFRIQDTIASMTRAGRADLGFNQLRAALEKLTVKWMDILEARNVSKQVTIEPDFRYRFGSEYLDIFTGSGRARLVLAIHGAIFEKYLEDENRPFRFLILDTPKQHELDSADLARYLDALQILCSTRNAQILVSSTEYRHPIGASDREWLPTYAFPDQNMYLGPLS